MAEEVKFIFFFIIRHSRCINILYNSSDVVGNYVSVVEGLMCASVGMF